MCAHIHDEFGGLLGSDLIILGELFWKLYLDWRFHGSLSSSFSAQHPGSFVLGVPDCFLVLRMLSILVSVFSGAETMVNEATQTLETTALCRGPRDLS